jgi:hypothetical protein
MSDTLLNSLKKLNCTLKLTLKQVGHILVYLHRHYEASTTNINHDRLLTNKSKQ